MAEYKSDRQKYCLECGAVISREAEVCPRCGVTQVIMNIIPPKTAKPQESLHFDEELDQLIYALLAITLGWMGGHRFYLGQWRLGLFYLLFSWTGMPLLIGILEGIATLRKIQIEGGGIVNIWQRLSGKDKGRARKVQLNQKKEF